MIDYEKELNEGQRAAVLFDEGPSLVIAGAGSGKTRVLTYKIAHLLEQGYEASSILALTFTNKAAKEMKQRIANKVGAETARYLWMGTFHAVFSRILRSEAKAIGFPSDFTIYDQTDSRNLIKTIISEMGLDKSVEADNENPWEKKEKSPYKPATIQSFISMAKNHLILPTQYANDKEIQRRDTAAKVPATRDIYIRYMERCRQAGAMDFDDLLVYAYILFSQHPEICARYAQHFEYVLVDEYQDTNFVQHCLIWLLTQQKKRLCVVGDDAQSIYAFRGAKIENILQFTERYKGSKIFRLEQNYRSTQSIVEAANSLIAKNRNQIPKRVFSKNDVGDLIAVIEAESDTHEGEKVVGRIVSLHWREKLDYNSFAILYRTNAQSRIFEEALRGRDIPYRIYGGVSFYQRKEIKDVIAYCRLAINNNDEEAFKRIINYPMRGIGKTTLDKLFFAANHYGVGPWQVVSDPDAYGLAINRATKAKLQSFVELMRNLTADVQEMDVYEFGKSVITKAGIMADLMGDNDPESESRKENIEELLNGMHDFVTTRQEAEIPQIHLTDFLAEVSLLSEQDMDATSDEPRVTLMTIHAAKGLEFPAVFVVGMEEMLFPNILAQTHSNELEEERRLFYVALTRAERFCFLSYALQRFRFGKMELCMPSRFISDIDHQLLRRDKEERLPFTSQRFRQPSQPHRFTRIQASAPEETLKSVAEKPKTTAGQNSFGIEVGQWVVHDRFGVGEVTSVDGSDNNMSATIRFKEGGVKKLLLKYARLKKL